MKNKNIGGGGGGCKLNLISKKGPNAKMRKKYQTLKIFSSPPSLTRLFTKFIFLEQLTTLPQLDMQNMLLFFLSSHHDTNPLLHLYHFRKKYNYILDNINRESLRSHLPFYKIHISGAAYHHASVKYAKYVVVFFVFFSKQSS